MHENGRHRSSGPGRTQAPGSKDEGLALIAARIHAPHPNRTVRVAPQS